MAENKPCSPPETDVEGLRAENERLRNQVDRLLEELKKRDAIIQELQRSAKRQAAPFSKGTPKGKPKKPGRKPGAAYGRQGYRLPPKKLDETHAAPLPPDCPECGSRHVVQDGIVPQFQVEVPRKPIARQFNVAHGHCEDCGCCIHGHHPLQTSQAVGAAGSQLGPDAQALAVHLNKEAGLSHGKIARLFQTVFGISLSRGGSAHIILRAAERCRPAYHDIHFYIRNCPTLYADETGWRVGACLHWLWAFVTTDATLYLIRPSRGHDVPEEVLGAEFSGNFGQDGWSPYDFFTHACHQQCNAHLLTRCSHLLQTASRGAVRFPRAVKDLLQGGLRLRDRRDAGQLSVHGLAVATGRLQVRLDRLADARLSHPGNARFARHLGRHRNEIFTYLKHPELEATDWMGEQAIRPAVVNRKVWGGSRTENGADAQGILSSVLRTCWQRRIDGFKFMADTFRGLAPPLFSSS